MGKIGHFWQNSSFFVPEFLRALRQHYMYEILLFFMYTQQFSVLVRKKELFCLRLAFNFID